jgi:hypothetical protein
MYNTLVNIQSGPRVLGETFELRALPGTQHTLVDSLRAFSNGFGGDPNNFAKLDFFKGKLYDFSGMFRRHRDYFDYDLLGSPNIPSGQSIPIGPSNAPTGSLALPQVYQSPFLANTVRRMLDTSLTVFPLSKVTYRVGYSQNLVQGPGLSPGDSVISSIGANSQIYQEYVRNNSDDFSGEIDWKPVQDTRLTFEEVVDHIKINSYLPWPRATCWCRRRTDHWLPLAAGTVTHPTVLVAVTRQAWEVRTPTRQLTRSCRRRRPQAAFRSSIQHAM